jgi:hypothetical protein
MPDFGCWGDQAARFAGTLMTSMPSWNLTPPMTFGNWFVPFKRRQVFDAAIISLNTISLAVADESEPFVRTVLCRTVASHFTKIDFTTLPVGSDCFRRNLKAL